MSRRKPAGSAGSNLSGLWTLYVLTLRQHMHGKRWMLMALMFVLLAALVVVVRITAHHMTPIMIEFVSSSCSCPKSCCRSSR